MSIQILDEELVQQIERLAQQEQRQEMEVLARALRLYEEKAPRADAPSFLLAIAGLGSSGQTDISEHDEEILAAEVDPLRGWGLERAAS